MPKNSPYENQVDQDETDAEEWLDRLATMQRTMDERLASVVPDDHEINQRLEEGDYPYAEFQDEYECDNCGDTFETPQAKAGHMSHCVEEE